ncbi:Frag1/DRAM/Sfk1 family-domain-containing protein [Phanerochaete sordida]|uniref:Frag1/DRAM/Sfk1 family-domain-containing protein n=1 Tax=Phanerochaete sordida TaxID=48140 RepID=A0A9P3L7Z5_9APHY|nr:Frag1/DRAM/Sfk1 family-domain-containing protein [Phanerochaete sordida]
MTVPAARLAVWHTYLSFAAFFSALFIGSALHYKKIVKNGVAGYPEEWFPSVSATIGDWYPERNIFQILIALNSGPRFASLVFQYYLQRVHSPTLSKFLLVTGILRTLSCGGWVYITSTDDHDWHDILMISYIVLNLPWMYGNISATRDVSIRRRRRIFANTFFISIVPMIYFFIQHKVHRVPGAYTHYSFFEWGLIILDILYDSVTRYDFEAANLNITIGTPGVAELQPIGVVSSPDAKAKSSEIMPTVDEKSTLKQADAPPDEATSSQRSVRSFGSAFAFTCDLYLSYIKWSIWTSLTPTLFYFSVWELGITGSELSLLSTLSPIVLGIAVVRDIASSRPGRTVLHALSLSGLFAYLSKSPLQRLLIVAFANSVSCIGWTVDLSTTPASMGYQFLVFGLGLLLSSLSKHANHSNNPVWPIVHEASGGYNKTGIALAVLAIYNYYSRISDPSKDASARSDDTEKTPAKSTPVPTRTNWLADGFALGSYLFTLHCFLSDGSTLIAWSWTGYPIQGPLPHLHGSLTHVAQAVGLVLTAALPSDWLVHPAWFLYGAASATVMYLYKDWPGYLGGWHFALFLTAAAPAVLGAAAANRHVAKTFFVAFLAAALFDVANTFTVAYAFVPGGGLFRERTNCVLGAQMLLIGLAFRWPAEPPRPALTLTRRARTYVNAAVATLTIASFLVTMYRWPASPPVPYRPGPRIFRAGIWTVHFGIDNEGRDSQRRMRDLIKDMQLDVVGLLETDLHRVVYGNRDVTRVMLEDIGYYVDLGPGPNQHTWGAVLLSKFPILESTHHLLPSPDGELAPAIHAVLDVFGTRVHVVVAHNGQEETPLDRELQAAELARIMSEAYPEPVVFLGYVVTKPHAPRPAPYDIMVTDGRVHDIDKDDYDRWCEYIFYRGLYRTSYARVSRSTITDTELQIAQFQLPKHGVGVTNDTVGARYLRAWKEEMPEEHWFPPEYYPEVGGLRGHFYHVFNTPLYYKIPEGAVL